MNNYIILYNIKMKKSVSPIAYKKLLLIGDSKTGKTSLVKKMMNQNISEEYAKTEGIYYLITNRY